MYQWAPIPPQYRALGSREFARQLLAKATVSVSPGIGFGDPGDDHLRFALIDSESRIRQAVRGVRAMFTADGVVPAASMAAWGPAARATGTAGHCTVTSRASAPAAAHPWLEQHGTATAAGGSPLAQHAAVVGHADRVDQGE